MPTYSYHCDHCNFDFELFFPIKNYQEKPKCEKCNSANTYRRYIDDVITQNASVRKADSELKTIGDLANRNRDRMTSDEQHSLYQKHNSYKEEVPQKALPKGMSRIKKPKKIKWTKG